MLNKSNGFFLAELLLSFSVWLLLTLFFIPLYIQVSKQSQNVEYSREASRVLYDTLQEYVFSGNMVENLRFERKGRLFEISGNTLENKVCVRYEDSFQKEKLLCETIK